MNVEVGLLTSEELIGFSRAALDLVFSVMHDPRDSATILSLPNAGVFADKHGLGDDLAAQRVVLAIACYLLERRTDKVLALHRIAVLAALERPADAVPQ